MTLSDLPAAAWCLPGACRRARSAKAGKMKQTVPGCKDFKRYDEQYMFFFTCITK